ncbi:TIGR04282 family arsenosugar biosynthesis glycosyltransferase [Marinobacter sp. SS13-12]|uniref:TIGR04282 family arsenosugar biosynthesis glycosyltransferase n=1 Tax=Marinobacter sp. SS13-12 TaxID=3050451 RepID=UPI002554F722|nr:TIGR04282 family arsenosugar biosynthesis glycosyltransferase [Marinobacter sp. SS13-12]MDK8465012.1 TIGR04282 family arsenosugar biosynthesis glycosyltransferase [Marinobacter sp. SS13-12]
MQIVDPDSVLVMQFAKWPEAGRVKTRLMPELGAEGAMNAHVRLSLAVLENLVASGYDVRFLWDRPLDTIPDAASPINERLEYYGVGCDWQQGDVLGERMTLALDTGLQKASKAVIVGSDCPSVDAEYVRLAVAALDEVDVVLGPSDDGGYVLIGARIIVPDMLAGVAWGTENALEQTCDRLTRAGLTFALLPEKWDVDEPEDWRRFIGQSSG